MIIDCHGHYTTAPKPLQDYREKQIAGLKDPSYVPAKGTLNITDDQIRESLEGAQLKFQRERGVRRHDLLAAGVGDVAPYRKRNDEPALDRALQ